ncbi:MAG: MaoC/PaaZ C-terminal domain-containing protein [Pseudoclavibacter sp.]
MSTHASDDVVTADGLADYHGAVSVEPDTTPGFALYLAALTLPRVMEAGRLVVPARLHPFGLQVGHEVTLFAPLMPGLGIRTEFETSSKTSSAGELATVTARSRAGGELVAEQRATFLFAERRRGDSEPLQNQSQDEAADVIHSRFPVGAARAYAGASGDTNQIHLDADAARAAGFDRPIAHGLCTLAFVVADVARALGADAADVVAVGARFAGSVHWDESMVTVVDDAEGAHTFTTTTATGGRVLEHGFVQLAG